MPGGFEFDEIADVVEAFGGWGEPGLLSRDELGPFQGLGGTGLEGFALLKSGEVRDGADVLVGGEGWEDVSVLVGEKIDDTSGEIRGGEHFPEENGGIGAWLGGKGDDDIAAADDWQDHGEERQ